MMTPHVTLTRPEAEVHLTSKRSLITTAPSLFALASSNITTRVASSRQGYINPHRGQKRNASSDDVKAILRQGRRRA